MCFYYSFELIATQKWRDFTEKWDLEFLWKFFSLNVAVLTLNSRVATPDQELLLRQMGRVPCLSPPSTATLHITFLALTGT